MSQIETFDQNTIGYTPFLIRDGWQVATLNYMPGQDISNIQRLEKHSLTDEVFILLKGSAILIAAEELKDDFRFDCIKMIPNIVYNIKVNQWHNIAMDKDAELIIIEKNHTHVKDCEYRPLNPDHLRRLKEQVADLNNYIKSSQNTITNKSNSMRKKEHVIKQKDIRGDGQEITPAWGNDRELFELFRTELYTPVLGDVLDEMKCYHQFLPQPIKPIRIEDKLIGRSMPVLMIDVYGPQEEPFGKLTEALDQLRPGEVYVAAGGAMRCAYWGEILTATAKKRGSVGAVIDGYYRDTPRVMEQDWPVFTRGRYAQDSCVRTKVFDYRCAIEIGNVWIEPGDLIFGDMDGVLIIPKKHEIEVVTKALERARAERLVRQEIENGMSSTEAFRKYGIL